MDVQTLFSCPSVSLLFFYVSARWGVSINSMDLILCKHCYLFCVFVSIAQLGLGTGTKDR